MDFSNGHYLYLEILPNAGDAWVDMQGNAITQLGIGQREKGLNNPLCVYDWDLAVGELERSFDNFPVNLVQKVSDFQFSICGIWSDPLGNTTTTNVLWMLQDINAEYGKSLNIIGRKVQLWVSNSEHAGLVFNSGVWTNYSSTRFWNEPSWTAPTFTEQAELLFTGAVEEIKCGGSDGRIDIVCTDLIEDKVLGTAVPNAAQNGKHCIPITYGDFTKRPMPALIESDLRNLVRVWLGDESTPHVSFSSLAIYDETYDTFWPVANTYQAISNNNEIEFTANFAGVTQPFNLTTTDDNFHFQQSTYSTLMPTDNVQAVLTVDGENIGLHTPRLPNAPFTVANTSQQGTYSATPMQSRGWGNTVRTGHAHGAQYKMTDANLQAGLLTLDVVLTPTKIYDASSVPPPWGGYPHTDMGWDTTTNLLCGGNPWAVIQNSPNGGHISDPIVLSSKNHAIGAIESMIGYAEGHLVCEFPDLSGYGGTCTSAKLFMDGEFRSSHTCLPDTNVTGLYYGFGDTGANGSSTLLMAQGVVGRSQVFTYDASPLTGSMCPTDLKMLSKLTLYSFLDWDYNGIAVENDVWPTTTQPFFLLNAIKIVATITIPIKSTSKLFAFGWGRQPQNIVHGYNFATRVIGDLFFRNFGVTPSGTMDGLLLDFSVTEQIGFRSLVKGLAQSGCLSVTTDINGAPYTAPFLSHTNFGDVYTIGNDDVLLGDHNMPEVTYSIPTKSAVYSRFELRYGWDYAREKFTGELVADGLTNEYGYSGADATTYTAMSSDDWSLVIQLCSKAQGYIGQQSVNTFTLESKFIQDHGTAATLFSVLVKWLATPRMGAKVTCDYAQTQSAGLLQRVTLSVNGLPSRIASKPWVVTGIVDDLQPTSMTRTLTLTEIPPMF